MHRKATISPGGNMNGVSNVNSNKLDKYCRHGLKIQTEQMIGGWMPKMSSVLHISLGLRWVMGEILKKSHSEHHSLVLIKKSERIG